MVPPDLPRRRLSSRIAAASAVLAVLVTALGASVSAHGEIPDVVRRGTAVELADRGWIWPAASFRLERPYEAPAHRYGRGHRGVDVRPSDAAGVRAPADGGVAFAGVVAGRGVLTIDHGDGLVTTFEPVDSPLAMGDTVRRGANVGTLSLGGHAAAGTFHFGVRWHGEYINPLLLLCGVPRAVLLPCC